MSYVDAILNRKDTQLTWDDWEREAEVETCPQCGYVMRFWYITAFNGDGDYLESFTARKCLRCGHTKFYDPDH